MKNAIVALFIVVSVLAVFCKTKVRSQPASDPVSQTDSSEHYPELGDTTSPPLLRLCTEMFPEQQEQQNVHDTCAFIPDGIETAALSEYCWKWQPGQRKQITVCFTDGKPDIQDRIKTIAAEWERYTGAKFVYIPYSINADIKISFAKKGVSWSYIGSDSRKHNPSMNFGWLEEEKVDSLFTSVVLHEFGHAIGLVHEHQLPNGNPIVWNVKKVYSHFLNHGWEVPDIDRNILHRYQHNQLIGNKFDPNSIMIYYIPASLTENGYSTPLNVRLSKADKEAVTTAYQPQRK